MDNPDRDDFERGQTDEFILSHQEAPDLGVINRICLRHDNSGNRPGWFVVSVTIVNRSTGQEYTFVFNCSFARDEGDGSIRGYEDRILAPVQRFEPPYAGTRVWTHEMGSAETEAQANQEPGVSPFMWTPWPVVVQPRQDKPSGCIPQGR